MKIRIGRLTLEIAVVGGFLSAVKSHRRDAPRRNYFMFVQDIPLVVAPYALSDNATEPFFDLKGEEAEQSKARELLFTLTEEHSRHHSNEDLHRVVRHIAERCAWRGRLLIDTRDDRRGRQHSEIGDRIVHYGARECLDWWVARIANFYWQFRLVAVEGFLGIFLCRLHKSDVFDIRMPTSLDGVIRYRLLLRRIDWFDTIGPEYWLDGIATEPSSPTLWRIDHEAYRRLASAYRDRAARTWGWSGRDFSTSFKTEYFSLYRHFRMQRAAAILRTSIVDALNEYLRFKGVRAEVIVNTLKGSAEKEKTMERLKSGEISFGDAYQEAGFP
jgi:hypothetical protein